MVKTKEELYLIKIEYETVTNKLQKLSEDELRYVTGGARGSAPISGLQGSNEKESTKNSPWSETIDGEELIFINGKE